eukprot:766514-Pleurochrysis_carterae.AAC.2
MKCVASESTKHMNDQTQPRTLHRHECHCKRGWGYERACTYRRTLTHARACKRTSGRMHASTCGQPEATNKIKRSGESSWNASFNLRSTRKRSSQVVKKYRDFLGEISVARMTEHDLIYYMAVPGKLRIVV